MVMQQRAALEELGAMDLGSVGEVRIALGGAMAGEVGPRPSAAFRKSIRASGFP